MLVEVPVGIASVAVGTCVPGVEADGLVVVLDGSLVLAQVAVGDAPVVVSINMLRIQAYGLIVVLDGPLVVS